MKHTFIIVPFRFRIFTMMTILTLTLLRLNVSPENLNSLVKTLSKLGFRMSHCDLLTYGTRLHFFYCLNLKAMK